MSPKRILPRPSPSPLQSPLPSPSPSPASPSNATWAPLENPLNLVVNALASTLALAQAPVDAPQHLSDTLQAYSQADQQAIIRGLILQRPTLSETCRQAQSLLPRYDRNFARRAQLENKKIKDTAWLTDQWRGRHWLPEDIRAGLASNGTPEPSADVVTALRNITEIAQANKITDLSLLWAQGGILRDRVTEDLATRTKSGKLPRVRLCGTTAISIAKGLKTGKLALLAASEEHNSNEFGGLNESEVEYHGDDSTDDHDSSHGQDSTDDEFFDARSSPTRSLSLDMDFTINGSGNDVLPVLPSVLGQKRRLEDQFEDEHLQTLIAEQTSQELVQAKAKASQDITMAQSHKRATEINLARLQGQKDELDERCQRSNKFIANLDASMTRLFGSDEPDDSGIDLSDTANTDVLLQVSKMAAQSSITTANKYHSSVFGEMEKLDAEIVEAKKRVAEMNDDVNDKDLREKALTDMLKAKQTQDRVNEVKRRKLEIEKELENAEKELNNAEKAAQESFDAETKEKWESVLGGKVLS